MNLVRAFDLETVKAHYINVIENTPGIEKYARWVYGKHPTDETLIVDAQESSLTGNDVLCFAK